MAELTLRINGTDHTFEAPLDMPLLWVIRDIVGYTGTKFGCGIGQCSACTVHVAGIAMQACQTPVELAVGEDVTTIEGLSAGGLHRVQEAWVEEEVPQCGYCQPGMIMRAAAGLDAGDSVKEIEDALRRHICRCGTYDRIKAAVARAAGEAGR